MQPGSTLPHPSAEHWLAIPCFRSRRVRCEQSFGCRQSLRAVHFHVAMNHPTADAPVTPAPLQYQPIDTLDRVYRYWRFRILATTIFGYALFYFVRTNISVPLK